MDDTPCQSCSEFSPNIRGHTCSSPCSALRRQMTGWTLIHMLRKFSRMLAINMSTGSRTTRQVDYTHCKEAGRKQECGGSQEKLATQSMAGSDAAEKLGPVPRGPVQAKQRELYSADEEEQGRAPQPCSELDGTWVGRAGCAQGQPERLAAGRGLCRLPGRGPGHVLHRPTRTSRGNHCSFSTNDRDSQR